MTAQFADAAALVEASGAALGPGRWQLIDGTQVEAYREATALPEGFAGPVTPRRDAVPEHLLLPILGHLFGELFAVGGVRSALNYGLNSARFPASLAMGSRVRARATFTDVVAVPGGVQITASAVLEREGSDVPVCTAEPVVRFLF